MYIYIYIYMYIYIYIYIQTIAHVCLCYKPTPIPYDGEINSEISGRDISNLARKAKKVFKNLLPVDNVVNLSDEPLI